jgi:hypothetical protein
MENQEKRVNNKTRIVGDARGRSTWQHAVQHLGLPSVNTTRTAKSPKE